jgi:hypothetical protein
VHSTRWLTVVVGLLAAAPVVSADAPRTFRVDYYHTGNAESEIFSLDRLVLEPLPWPGNPDRPLDDTNLGKYFFEVRDLATQRVLYSRGFASIFGEWELTPEAKEVHRTFQESLRFPAPDGPVQLVLRKRDPVTLAFREVWSSVVDPANIFVDPSPPASPGDLLEFQKRGDPAHKVDLLVMGDGYTAAELGKFRKDVERLLSFFFEREPFHSHRDDFNVWGLCPASTESGISRPSTGIHHRTPLGATYDAFGSERYVLTFDNRRWREVASFAPYDVVAIVANGKTYGGGGIFNLYATVAADSMWAPYVFIHELGHHIAALADEYFTSDVAYESAPRRPEPWEPNVTALHDPSGLKWKDLVAAGTPVPTPWDEKAWIEWQRDVQERRKKIRAERRPESEMDALFQEEKKRATELLASEEYAGKVGAFEGANYEAKGYYRPELDCIMFTRDDVPFCAVCRRTLERLIRLYTEGP